MVSSKQVVSLGDIPCVASKFVFLSAEEGVHVKVGNLTIRPIPTQRYSVYALVPLSLRYLVL